MATVRWERRASGFWFLTDESGKVWARVMRRTDNSNPRPPWKGEIVGNAYGVYAPSVASARRWIEEWFYKQWDCPQFVP